MEIPAGGEVGTVKKVAGVKKGQQFLVGEGERCIKLANNNGYRCVLFPFCLLICIDSFLKWLMYQGNTFRMIF